VVSLVLRFLVELIDLDSEKLLIYDQERVNGGSNYEYSGQRWIPKLAQNKR